MKIVIMGAKPGATDDAKPVQVAEVGTETGYETIVAALEAAGVPEAEHERAADRLVADGVLLVP